MKIKRVLILSMFILTGLLTLYGCSPLAQKKPEGNIYNISVSPNGKLLVLTTSSGVWVYRLSDRKIVYYIEHEISYQYQGIFSYITWSPDGKYLAVGKPNAGVWIWDTENWKLITEQSDNINERYINPGFAWSPKGNQLALGIGNGKILIWEKEQNSWKSLENYPGDQISIAWALDGELLVLSESAEPGLYNAETGKLVHRLDTAIDGAGGPAIWSPDMKHVFIFFDLGGGMMSIEKNQYDDFGLCCYPEVAWSMDGRYFAAVSEDGNEISVWDTAVDKISTQKKQGDVVYALAWTPTNELLAVGLINEHQVLWNTNSGGILFEIPK